MSNKGKIIQVMGPVVDVAFEDENLPAIRDALEVNNGDKKCVMEVAQHIPKVLYLFQFTGLGIHLNPEVEVQGTIRLVRSEERRVGKECRSRWSPYH